MVHQPKSLAAAGGPPHRKNHLWEVGAKHTKARSKSLYPENKVYQHRRSSSVLAPNDYYPFPSQAYAITSLVSSIALHLHLHHHHHHQPAVAAIPLPGLCSLRSTTTLCRGRCCSNLTPCYTEKPLPLPEDDPSSFNASFPLGTPLQESPFNVSRSIGGIARSFPTGSLILLAAQRTGSSGSRFGPRTLGPYPDAMDSLPRAVSCSSHPHRKLRGPFNSPPFSRQEAPLSHGDDGSMPGTTNPYMPPPPASPCPFTSRSRTPPSATAFSDMWKDVGGDAYGG